MLAAPGPPPEEVPVDLMRAAHEAETEAYAGTGPPVAEVEDVAVPGPGGEIPVRLYRPDGRPGPNLLPAKYADAKTSGLEVEGKEGGGEIKLELEP